MELFVVKLWLVIGGGVGLLWYINALIKNKLSDDIKIIGGLTLAIIGVLLIAL